MRWDSMRVWATIDHSNDCSLNRQSFCMDYAVSWAKLEVMVITLEPQTSNIAGSSCKYTNGFFICCYIRGTALSLLDVSQVVVTGKYYSNLCLLYFEFLLKAHTFSYTILSSLTTQCARAPCVTNAAVCSVRMLHTSTRVCYLNVYQRCNYFYIIAKLHDIAYA